MFSRFVMFTALNSIESVTIVGSGTVSVIRIEGPAAPLILVTPVTVRLLLRLFSRTPLATESMLVRSRKVNPLPATPPVVPAVFSRSIAAPPLAVIVAGLLKLIVPPFFATSPVPFTVVMLSESNE